ncbi:glycosyl hydrolase family 95 catalytic domain-containing protein [Kribbella sp. NPDC051587]|uniref:glycosyl hydrolase family 95 catalytic domain-containing protein n=1 Tax=Kribbella sp. NPDC051587 TaxID=3364119 RepID=UPI00379E5676
MPELSRRTLLAAAGGTAAWMTAAPGAYAAARPPVLPTVSPSRIEYREPAREWEPGALPIGNGRLGAMLFGGVQRDRIQLSEQSLWGGVNNYDNGLAGVDDNAFDTSMTGFGSFRNFGDLYVDLGGRPTELTAPGGPYESSSSETVSRTIDGRSDTKWCVISPPAAVVWQLALRTPTAVNGYSLTSANDVPARDPQTWVLEGSNDEQAWTALDRQQLSGPFNGRLETRHFGITTPASYGFYRLTFTPVAGVSHFQVAEIALDGVDPQDTPHFTEYRRSLDLVSGVHSAEHVDDRGVRIRRTAFASREDDVLVLRYVADGGRLSARLSLLAGQGAATTAERATLRFNGAMGNGLRYAAEVQAKVRGGTTAVDGTTIQVNDCQELVLYLDGRTDYALSAAAGWRGGDPTPAVRRSVARAVSKGPDVLLKQHQQAFSARMRRVSVDWGTTDPTVAALPTDARLTRYADGGADPSLEQTLFTYSRYLLASCSRPDGLPANLQGLWNDQDQPAWASDYHTNINVQMNYWGAETTDLPESHEALTRFVEQVAVPSRVATRHAFGADTRGWTARTSQSAFGGNSWQWNTVASAWYAQHLWEHYAFTQDRDYLQRHAYPLIKEICEFWEDRLVEDASGHLVSPDGWSPEHGPREDGVMYDQQIIWDLFQNYLDAATTLSVDASYRRTIADLQARLAPNKVGRWGQLQEWQTDRDDPADIHRHTSHLFAVYPGRQITPTGTPALAAAALVSLKARCGEKAGEPFTAATVSGDSRRSWTWPWRCALFARLGDGERAAIMVRGLLMFNTLPNLFATHPPFQIDGNLGVSGAIAEVLLQSHAGEIALLPALPPTWAKGSFRGLRARGGYRVDCTWSGGRVQSFRITADRTSSRRPVQVRVNGRLTTVTPDRS